MTEEDMLAQLLVNVKVMLILLVAFIVIGIIYAFKGDEK